MAEQNATGPMDPVAGPAPVPLIPLAYSNASALPGEKIGKRRNLQWYSIASVLSLFFASLALALFIYWLAWVFNVHNEMRAFTAGAYSVSPAKAVGFCLIPIFNFFWLAYMPYQLARELEVQLGSKRIKASVTLTLCILSIVPGACLFGLGTLFRASAMSQVQNGLNELWRRSRGPSPTTRASTSAAAALAAMTST